MKLGLQFRYQNGQVQVNHNHFLGYTKDADGNLIIDPEQAEVVKRIYREYLEGYSMDRIAKGLEADSILTGAGKTKWWTSTINKILRNEKYIDEALVKRWLKRITVWEDHFTVELKSELKKLILMNNPNRCINTLSTMMAGRVFSILQTGIVTPK